MTAMTGIKTRPEEASVDGFIAALVRDGKREEAGVLDALFRRVTRQEPRMWGPTIIGYGQYHYRYESGREGVMCRVGFSPRAARHSLYLIGCEDEADAAFAPLLARLGKYARGKSCLYVNKLADVELAVLEDVVALGWARSFERYPA